MGDPDGATKAQYSLVSGINPRSCSLRRKSPVSSIECSLQAIPGRRLLNDTVFIKHPPYSRLLYPMRQTVDLTKNRTNSEYSDSSGKSQ